MRAEWGEGVREGGREGGREGEREGGREGGGRGEGEVSVSTGSIACVDTRRRTVRD